MVTTESYVAVSSPFTAIAITLAFEDADQLAESLKTQELEGMELSKMCVT